jgi:hypothetical protein
MLSDGSAMIQQDFERAVQAGQIDPLAVEVVGRPREARSHKVTHTLLSGAEVLEKPQTWPGRFIPIIPVFGDEVNVEGKRFLRSLVRDAKDPQRNYNYWRTAATELVALAPKAPFIGARGSFDTDATNGPRPTPRATPLSSTTRCRAGRRRSGSRSPGCRPARCRRRSTPTTT